MRILLVGGGGREHALGWRLAGAGHQLSYTHDNPGLAALGRRVDGDLLDLARGMDLVVIGPEGPLGEGVVDQLAAAGIPAFGPTQRAARLETSKIFAKEFLVRHGLPTAPFVVVRGDPSPRWEGAGVVKLDGLAAGKGVWVCDATEVSGAVAHARAMRPRDPILLEGLLIGPEVSVLALSDGESVVPLLAARDHKRRFEGDRGPNTGGMGAVAPVHVPEIDACVQILARAVQGMAAEGSPYRGVLYGGFMLTAEGPMVLEFNARFGDPECQPLMALLAEDLAPWLLGSATGKLPGNEIRFRPGAACCVVVCGEQYPERGADAPILALPLDTDDLLVFHAGTRTVSGELRAVGGRVLGVTGVGVDLPAARARAYEGVSGVQFEGAAWRTDIGLTST